MYEPWYQTQGPDATEVERKMQQTEFHVCLHKLSHNPSRDNLILCTLLKEKMNHCPKHITFESIRKIPDWRKKTRKILLEEIEKEKPFGSYRGFNTFVFGSLYKNYISRVIIEVWAAHTISKLKPFWLEKYLSPSGKGFQNASNAWEQHINQTNA